MSRRGGDPVRFSDVLEELQTIEHLAREAGAPEMAAASRRARRLLRRLRAAFLRDVTAEG
ncbi:MAG TPA: hypothetical protein VNO79_01185 [Actinomycetota bacterium]|nr:hypothetical protein [Actinomycetota bacterium]